MSETPMSAERRAEIRQMMKDANIATAPFGWFYIIDELLAEVDRLQAQLAAAVELVQALKNPHQRTSEAIYQRAYLFTESQQQAADAYRDRVRRETAEKIWAMAGEAWEFGELCDEIASKFHLKETENA